MSFLAGGNARESSVDSLNGGMSRGRKQDQTTSESAAERKARETAAARQASGGDVSEMIAARSSSGRRSISQAAMDSASLGPSIGVVLDPTNLAIGGEDF